MSPSNDCTQLHDDLYVGSCHTLYIVIEEGLRLLHPFMPYITEDLWQRLPKRKNELSESICVATYPLPKRERENNTISADFELVKTVASTARSLQALYGITQKQAPKVILNVRDSHQYKVLSNYKPIVTTLAFADSLDLVLNSPTPPEGCAVEICGTTEVHLHIKGLVDLGTEIARLKKKTQEVEQKKTSLQTEATQADFANKPDTIRQQHQEKINSLTSELTSLSTAVATMLSL